MSEIKYKSLIEITEDFHEIFKFYQDRIRLSDQEDLIDLIEKLKADKSEGLHSYLEKYFIDLILKVAEVELKFRKKT